MLYIPSNAHSRRKDDTPMDLITITSYWLSRKMHAYPPVFWRWKKDSVGGTQFLDPVFVATRDYLDIRHICLHGFNISRRLENVLGGTQVLH